MTRLPFGLWMEVTLLSLHNKIIKVLLELVAALCADTELHELVQVLLILR
jgi:hypothetical protein